MRRRISLAAAAVVVVVLGLFARSQFDNPHPPKTPVTTGPIGTWRAAWTAGTESAVAAENKIAAAGFKNETIRNIAYLSAGGDAVRVRLSNQYGTSPLLVGAVTVAGSTGASAATGQTFQVTFGGATAVSIPVGQIVTSDAVHIQVSPQDDLAVSIYVPRLTGPATYHGLAMQQNWIALGNQTANTSGEPYVYPMTSWYYLAGVDVASTSPPATIVALGDSLVDGAGSDVSSNHRWPNLLADRLVVAYGSQAPAVVDEGISGNRLLIDSDCYGPSGIDRLTADVLDQPGVKVLILAEGLNDILVPDLAASTCAEPQTRVSADQLIAGYQQVITAANAHGIKVFCATITPAGHYPGFGAESETERQAVNTWIRTSNACAGVLDFDAAVRSPTDPQAIVSGLAYSDHIHLDNAGYQKLADTFDLAALYRAAQ